MKQIITLKGTFDAAHRLVESMTKCANIHGHTYHYTIIVSFTSLNPETGYAVDFGKIKPIIKAWIDENLDHGYICNPTDTEVIKLCASNGWKHFKMHFGKREPFQWLNPTVENIAKMLAYYLNEEIEKATLPIVSRGIKLHAVSLDETPTCGTLYSFDANDFI